MAQKVQLSGEDMGAKYGYSLAAGDLDADGAHDLVVGAPLAPGQLGAPDAGKIYVYYAPLKEHVSRATLILRGQHSWGHFGLAVTCPGDLNQDGYEDVVVGAPEAAGTAGIIYVYNGGADGLTPHPTQVIRGGDIPGGVSGLGFSLSTGLDIDLNGYPDLVAGSALSDTAVVIRTSPVVTLIGEVTFDRLIISLENKTCMVTPQGSQVSEDVACLNVVINLQYTSKVTDQLGKYSCITTSTLYVSPTQPGRVHLQSPVSMVVSASLHQVTPEGVQEGLSRVPNTLNILGDTTFTAHARIGCVDAASCFSKPDLHLSARVTSEFTVGDGKLVVEVMVHSRNDSAYSVQLVLGYQQQLVFQRVSGSSLIPTCKPADSSKDQRSYLTCKFTSDFHKEEQVTLRFHLEYTPEILLNHMLTSGAREVTFYLNVTSDSRDLNDTDNTYSFTIPAKTQVNLQVTGISNPESVEGRVNTSATLSELFPVEVPTVPVTLASPQHLGPRLSHQYSITNSGPSPVLSLKVLLRLPLQLGTDIPLLYLLESLLTSGPIACSSPPLNPNGFNFTSHHGREGSDDMDVTGDVGTVNETADTDLSMTDIVSHPRGRRHRRQTDNDKDTDVVFNRTRMEDKGVLSCQLMSCAEVMCEVPTLRAGEVVTVTVSGYAVVASLKLLRRRSVLIKSSLEVEVQDAHYYDLINSDINIITASTQVAIIRKNEVGSRKFGWWHWLLILLISFIIIIIIIIILKKVGFFERKRVPGTDTEILTEGDKNEKKDKDEEEEGQEKEV
nr:integrin alpha pat-2-like [Cherax quadricarinatus]